jgi:hypothetical protein
MPGTLDLFDATLDSAEEAELVHYFEQAADNIPDDDDLPVDDSAVADTVDDTEAEALPLQTSNINKTCLYELFDRRIKEKKWSLRQRMPREKKDVEFDTLLKDLSLKRAYGSRMWLHYRKSRGISAALKITESTTSLLSSFSQKTGASTIEIDTLSKLNCWPWYVHDYDDKQTIASLFVQINLSSHILKRVSHLNANLAESLHNMTANNLDERILKSELERQTSAGIFVRGLVDATQELGVAMTQQSLRRLFYRLDCLLIETWKETIIESKDKLVREVDYGDVDTILKGSKGTLYYVSGWMMFVCRRLCRFDSLSTTIERFVEENRHKGGGNLPMGILERREIHFGKLQRVGTNFFRFMLMHESLYVINLTPSTALTYKACLFVEIQKMVASSETLKDLFRECFPASFTAVDIKNMWKIYDYLLAKYSTLRARDVLKKMRAATRQNHSAGFSTRECVKVAELAAAANGVGRMS